MGEKMEVAEYTQVLGKALEEVQADEPEQSTDDGLIHLSTGVVLAPRKVSPFVFQEVSSRFKYPKVPVIWMEDKQREEPNPMNPDYLAERDEVDYNRSMATIDGTIALGTKLVSIPEGFPTPDDNDWLDDLETMGIEINRDNSRMRYRTWVKYVAAPTVPDVQTIIAKVLRAIGVSEEEVVSATANFRSLS
jgi:hypothetical protein